MVFAGAGDVLRARGAPGFAVTGPEGGALAAETDNLVLRAARALAAAAGLQAEAALDLEKHLPVASGIGGGSADAAAALRLLNRVWGLDWDEERLAELALPLGADVPACVGSRACVMGGIGDVLRPAPHLPRLGLVLANPRIALATPAVFKARVGGFSEPASLPREWPNADMLARDLAALRNDLEPPAIAICPQVGEVLHALRTLPGCLLARMSGSGATCFGLFATPAQAAEAARHLPPPGGVGAGGFTGHPCEGYDAAGWGVAKR